MTDSTKETKRIDAKLLIPGRGAPITNGTVIIQGKHIAYAGATSSLPISLSSVPVDVAADTILPGLWDAHVHYFGPHKLTLDAIYETNPALAGARTAHDLTVTLNAGFTSVRELGGWGHHVMPAVDEGAVAGPSVYSAIAPISMTGGHGDAQKTPLVALKDSIDRGLPLALCDGEAECIKAVRFQLRKGAKAIKIIGSGGCSSTYDDPEHQEFSFAEMKAMVDEASRSDRAVAAHCHGKTSIMSALHAGCSTIEHGTYLDEEVLALAKEKGAMFIMTRNFFAGGLQVKDFWNPESYEKIKAAAATHKAAYELAVRSGAKIATGTDLGLSGVVDSPVAKYFSHGSNGREIVFAVEAGMTPLQAIEAATANGAETLGKMAPKAGQLREGWDADVIAVEGNPLEDIRLLAQPQKVVKVWRHGKLMKG